MVFILVTQTMLAYGLRDASWPWIFFFAYLYGGTVNHTQQLAAHELSHNLCWENGWANKLTGILANLSTTIPSSISFQKYHVGCSVDVHAFVIVCRFHVDVILSLIPI